MADRYDPKLSVRPLNERKQAPPASAGEDPLVELARIVSGRTTFDPAPPPRPKTVPVNGSVAPDMALAQDLESELLNDLQASFSSTFYAPQPPLAAPPPVPAAAPPPAKPAAQAARPAAAPPPRAQSGPAAAAAAAAPATPPAGQGMQAQRPAARAERAAPAQPPRQERPAAAPGAIPTRGERQAAVQPPPERPPAAARPAVAPGERKPAAAEAAPRPASVAASAAAAVEAAVSKPTGRWDPPPEKLAAPRPTVEPSRFAPPSRRGGLFGPRAVPEPEPAEEDLPDIAAFGDGAETAYADDPLPPEDLDGLPVYGDEELPPFPDEMEEYRRRPRRGLVLGGALLAVILAAGVAFMMMRGERGGGAPPIITADATPAKIAPAVAPADNDEPNKLFHDRVDGADGASGTKLVTPGDEPVAAAPAAPADENNPISRVIEPGGPGFDPPSKPADAGAAAAAEAAGGNDHPVTDAAAGDSGDNGQIAPKKVRTVVVRPDMTVVSSKAASADDAGKLPPGANPAVPPSDDGAAAADASGKAQADAGVDGGGKGAAAPVAADAAAGGNGRAAGGGAPPGSVPASGGGGGAAPDAGAAASADGGAGGGDAAPAAKPPVPASKPAVVATRSFTPTDPAQAKPGKAAAASGGVLVQVSAQKSEDAAKASYRDLQGKFPAILGKLDPNILRVDLGDKGVFFRVRVGPFASADAQKVCSSLKAAGGDCIIAH